MPFPRSIPAFPSVAEVSALKRLPPSCEELSCGAPMPKLMEPPQAPGRSWRYGGDPAVNAVLGLTGLPPDRGFIPC